jgi:hypothetical protein
MFFSAEKLTSVWKDLLKEYKTVLVNFTKSGNHESSFMKAKQVTPVPLHLIQNLSSMMMNLAWKQVADAVLPVAYPAYL